MKVNELIDEAVDLPVEERVQIIDSLLKTLNMPDTENDRQWLDLAKKRLEQIHSGEAELISSEEVFKNISAKLS